MNCENKFPIALENVFPADIARIINKDYLSEEAKFDKVIEEMNEFDIFIHMGRNLDKHFQAEKLPDEDGFIPEPHEEFGMVQHRMYMKLFFMKKGYWRIYTDETTNEIDRFNEIMSDICEQGHDPNDYGLRLIRFGFWKAKPRNKKFEEGKYYKSESGVGFYKIIKRTKCYVNFVYMYKKKDILIPLDKVKRSKIKTNEEGCEYNKYFNSWYFWG